MLSKEMLSKIRHIEIKSNRMVDEIFAGDYKASFRGKGMEFADIREYYPGDDVRNIDWNVTARHNKAYVKQFMEERELNLFILVDMSLSNSFGDKKEKIAEIAATLSFSAIRNNDRVGAMLFTDRVEKLIPSKKGKKHVLSVIDELLSHESEGKGTDIDGALKYFLKVMKRPSILFIISDFMDMDYEDTLNRLSRKHDVVLIQVIDPKEEALPKGAIFRFEDLETGEVVEVDNRKGLIKGNPIQQMPKKNLISVRTDEDYIRKLKAFFARRIAR
ncbi:DUF58 domain-containing protein [Acidaminobacter sp. JC074]|uniref:DUF58 domain-containing protein n=1 Tax=Acidaminobacter sp. JC074 TaxID=2530199 RepID=UPI001F1151AF|nr:DUF58 domain-containing protein [Acidaminobacter sp. JC074]MCH4886048.1 DUF58 domain-containing protein [Acidaminobacter sp. JC074]